MDFKKAPNAFCKKTLYQDIQNGKRRWNIYISCEAIPRAFWNCIQTTFVNAVYIFERLVPHHIKPNAFFLWTHSSSPFKLLTFRLFWHSYWSPWDWKRVPSNWPGAFSHPYPCCIFWVNNYFKLKMRTSCLPNLKNG